MPHNLGLTSEDLGALKSNLRPVRKSASDIDEANKVPTSSNHRHSSFPRASSRDDTRSNFYATYDREQTRYGNIGEEPWNDSVQGGEDLYKNMRQLSVQEGEDYYNVRPPGQTEPEKDYLSPEDEIDKLYEGMWQPAHRSSFSSDYASGSNRSSFASDRSVSSDWSSSDHGSPQPRGLNPVRISGQFGSEYLKLSDFWPNVSRLPCLRII